MRKSDNFKYILRLYNLVNEYLLNNQNIHTHSPEIIVSFCTVTERVFKMLLYKKNPVLIFDCTKLKEDDRLAAIISRKDVGVDTIKIREVINRYNAVFKNRFSDDEFQALMDIYSARNNLVHGFRSDTKILADEKIILKKVGTVWEKISNEVIKLFGKEIIKANKPKEKYTAKELEDVLETEVRKKISRNKGLLLSDLVISSVVPLSSTDYPFYPSNIICPRCSSDGFSLEKSNSLFELSLGRLAGDGIVDIYSCKKCNLELTRKEYEIAKKISKL